MNFVEAAIELLREQKGPLPVDQLCQLALDRGLIDKPGATPLRSMKGRLTTELNRGNDSRLVRLDGDLWMLAEAARDAEDAEDAHAVDEADDLAVAERGSGRGEQLVGVGEGLADEEDDDEEALSDDLGEGDFDDAEGDDDLDDGGDDDAVAAAAVASPADALVDDDDDIDDDDELDDDGELDDDDDAEDDAEDDADAGPAIGEAAPTLTAEELALQEIYSDEDPSTTPAAELAEYRDAQTADEDRPMLPEITPDRGRGRGRDDRRRGRERERDARRDARRAERERAPSSAPSSAGAPAGAPAAYAREPLTPGAQRPATSAEPTGEPVLGPGAGLAERATFVLASIKGAQPVPVRQLAQMMRKRRLVDDDPEKMWRPLKAALLHEQQRRQAAGLSPRVIYRGRDLFAYRGAGGALDAAEAQIEFAMAAMARATEDALVRRLGELQLGALEQVAHLYLTAAGYHGIDWIKRVDRSSYAVAHEPGSSDPLLVGVRAGDQPVDRRGVGELRAGVQAKNASRGLLLAARALGGEAEAELARPGRPLAVLAGAPLAGALIRVGVGVQVRSVPIGFLDHDLFDRLGDL